MTTSSSINVHLRFFSVLADLLGRRALTLTLPHGTTGKELLELLGRRYVDFERHRSSVRLAVNQEYVPEATVLNDQDEVALITPVSGG